MVPALLNGMDVKHEVIDVEAAPEKSLNFDDFIQPFYIKNINKGHLLGLKEEPDDLSCGEERGYLYNLLRVKQEENDTSEENVNDSSVSHRLEKPHKCDSCFYSFKSKYNLILHRKTHMYTKQYACHICGYRAVLPTTIKKHMIVHSNSEKEYKCSWCNFQTMYKHSLQFHIKRHTGEKPFHCSICDYRTIQKANLAFHMRHHTGDRYFNCALCEYKTTNKSYLEVHHNMKHRQDDTML